jgi:tetratricopeptide (TPR) repeat protein
MIMVIPVAAGLALVTEGGSLVFTVALALMGAYVFDTGTRAAALALVIEAVVILFLARGSAHLRKVVLAGGGLLLLLCFLGPRGLENRPLEAYRTLIRPVFTEAQSATPPASVMSLRARRAILFNTLLMIGDAPLRGVGLGNHPVFYPRYALKAVPDPLFSAGRELDFAHDDYLQIAAELGIVGLGLALLLVVSVLGRGRAGVAGNPFRFAALAGIVGILVEALFGFPAYRAQPPLVAALFAALLLGESGRILLPLGRRFGLVLVLGTALLALGVAVIETRSFLADRHIERMMAAATRGKTAAVRAEAEAAHDLDPSRKEPLFYLGDVFLAAGEPDHAAEVLAQEVELYPNERVALGNLGLAYEGVKSREKALEADRRLEAIDPRDAALHARMTVLLESLKQWHEGLGEARLAVLYDPQNPAYQYRRGILALQDHSLDEAQTALEQALRLDPRMARAHKALGVLLLNAGHTDEALTHFSEALDLEPGIADAAHMREVIAHFAHPK